MSPEEKSRRRKQARKSGNPPDQPTATLSKALTVTLAIAILALALAVRLYSINSAPLWHDEAYTLLAAELPPAQIVDLLKHDSGPPLYYFLLHYWVSLFEESELAVRSLSTLFSILLIAGIFWAGQRLYSTEAGLLAALIAATSPIQIHYSQQVRMYTLLPLVSLASIYFLVRYLQTSQRRYIALCAVATILCLYTHSFTFFLLPVHLTLILFEGGRQKRWKDLAVMYAVVGFSYLPWLPVFLLQLKNKDPIAWFSLFWQDWGPLEAVAWTLSSFSPGGAQPPIVDGFNVPAFGRVGPACFFGVLVVAGVAHLIKTRWSRDRLGALCFSAYMIVPLACSVISSVLISPNYLAGRVDQMVFPAFCVIAALGICAVPSWNLRWPMVGTMLILSALTLQQFYGRDFAWGAREVSDFISARIQSGDPIVCTGLTRTSLTYYMRRHGGRAKMFSYPRDTAQHLGYQNNIKLLENPDYLAAEAQGIINDMRSASAPGGRFFVVLGYALMVNKPLWEKLSATADLELLEPPSYVGPQNGNDGVVVLRYQFKK